MVNRSRHLLILLALCSFCTSLGYGFSVSITNVKNYNDSNCPVEVTQYIQEDPSMVSSASEWAHTLPEYTGANRTDYAVGGENRIHSEAVLTFSVAPADSITKVYVYAQIATIDPVDGTYYWSDIAVDYNFLYPASTTVTLGFVDIWPTSAYEPGDKHIVYWGVKVNGDSDDYTYAESDYYLLSQSAEPTATPTSTTAPTSTFTPAPTPTGVWTPTATRTFTNTPTVPTPTPTGTATPTFTPTRTPAPATPTAADAILADSTGDFIIFPWTHTTSQGRHRAYWYEWFYTFGGLPTNADYSSSYLECGRIKCPCHATFVHRSNILVQPFMGCPTHGGSVAFVGEHPFAGC